MDGGKTELNRPVIFRTETANEGGCFNSTTGVFTVTIPGSYVFTATAGSSGKYKSVYATIVIDSTTYTHLHASYTSVGSCSIAVKLGAGQKVWMKARNPPGDYCCEETSFSGALIQPLL